MRWVKSWRADPAVLPVANRHYNRQKPDSKQFVPPGRCLVLRDGFDPITAFWVTSFPYAKHVKHRWAGAWVCSAFRREPACGYRASDLIVDALAATRWYYGKPPAIATEAHGPIAMVTFVDMRHVRPKRDPGYCYRMAGFEPDGLTIDEGLVALVLPVDRVPVACAPRGAIERHRDYVIEAA